MIPLASLPAPFRVFPVMGSTIPNSNDGYVAAAYIVFFAIVLIYVAIMAVRLGRVERKVKELHPDEREHPEGARRERETV